MGKDKRIYVTDELVKVDMSGSGKGVVFAKVISSETDTSNPYNTLKYTLEGIDYPINEYYIRPTNKVDLKYKKIFEEKKMHDFEIDEDKIKRDFWESQRDIIKSTRNFVNDFYPYLIEKKHVLPVSKMTDWDSYYKKGYTTKNEWIFVIPHENFNIIVQKNATYVTLIITCPDDMHMFRDNNEEDKKNRSGIAIYNFCVEYSDDEFVAALQEITEDIISQLEEGYKKRYYHIHPNYETVKKLVFFKNPLDALNGVGYRMHQNSLPGYEYTRALFDIGIWRYSFFNWND